MISAAVAAALAAWWAGPSLILAVGIPMVLVGVLLAEIDVRCLRLPDPLVAALAILLVTPLTVITGLDGRWDRLGRAATAAVVVLLLHLLIALLTRGGLGLGDVKLAGVLGFLLGWTGWPTVLLGVVLPHLLTGPVVLTLLVRRRIGRRTAVPFGPGLLAGTLIAVVTSGA